MLSVSNGAHVTVSTVSLNTSLGGGAGGLTGLLWSVYLHKGMVKVPEVSCGILAVRITRRCSTCERLG